MGHNSQQLENLFRKISEKQTEAPSAGTLRKLKFRLWKSDFFSTNLNKVNYIYAAILAGGLAAVVSLTLFSDQSEEKTTVKEVDFYEQAENIADDPEIKTEEPALEQNKSVETSGRTLLSAMFISESSKRCAPAGIQFYDRSVNAVKWHWNFGNGDVSGKQNPEYIFKKPGNYAVVLTVEDASGNKDVYTKEIVVNRKPVADFEIDIDNSDIADRKIIFKNKSENASGYLWDFGDYKTSDAVHPVHIYNDFSNYRVKLIAKASNGCSDTTMVLNKFIEQNYELSFPAYFKPNPFERNNNGLYEIAENEPYTFYPLNNGAKEYSLTIFTSDGLKVFETKNIKQGWNGYFGGSVAPGGIYRYVAKGTYPNGKKFEVKGRVKVLIEDYYYKF